MRISLSLCFLLLCLSNKTNCLTPQKLPSGMNKKFEVNKSERNKDLKIMSAANINLLTKHWLNNILCSKEVYPEDKYLIEQIDIVNEYIKCNTRKLYTKTNDTDMKNIYIAWCPKGYYKEIIFIVIGELLLEERSLAVKYIIHSPFWESSQVSSVNLKYALEDLISNVYNLKLDLSYLYENDERYKLSWMIMGSEMNDDKRQTK